MYVGLPEPGDVIGKYRICEELGRGAMGVIFAVEDTEIDKPLALKWLLPELAMQPEFAARFLREARAASRVNHPNVVNVWAVGEEGGAKYIVMERLYGQSLGRRIEAGPLGVDETLSVMMDVLRGLIAAHEKGVTHRDLKPDNIFLCTTEGGIPIGPKVLDFGISKFEGLGGQSIAANVVGTPSYMAVEQILQPKSVDYRTDVYALGVIMYECLSASVPFVGESLGEVWGRIQNEEVVPISERCSVPRSLESIVHKAMARERQHRYQSARALLEALEGWKANRSSHRSSHRAPAPWGTQGELSLADTLHDSPSPLPQAVERERASSSPLEFHDDGTLRVDDLEEPAKEVLLYALELLGETGQDSVTNRLLLCAFLEHEERVAWKRFAAKGIDPQAVRALMHSLSQRGGTSTAPQQLTLEACRRSILPTLRVARSRASSAALSEGEVFSAFCHAAPRDFRNWLSTLDVGVYLERFGGHWLFDRYALESGAFAVLERARVLAGERGLSEIPNRILLGALLAAAEGPVAVAVSRCCSPQQVAAVQQLCLQQRQGSPTELVLNERSSARVVLPVLSLAAGMAKQDPITELDLLRAFAEAAPEGLGVAMGELFGVSLEKLAAEALAVRHAAPRESDSEIKAKLGPRLDAAEFSTAAWRLIQDAARLAQNTGWAEIRSRHLLAALIEHMAEPEARPEAAKLKELVLSSLPSPPLLVSHSEQIGLAESAKSIVMRASEKARKRGDIVQIDDLAACIPLQGDAILDMASYWRELYEAWAQPEETR